MTDYLVYVEVDYNGLQHLTSHLIQAESEVWARKRALLKECNAIDFSVVGGICASNKYHSVKHGVFTYKVVKVIELQTVRMEVNYRETALLIPTDLSLIKNSKDSELNSRTKTANIISFNWTTAHLNKELNVIKWGSKTKGGAIRFVKSIRSLDCDSIAQLLSGKRVKNATISDGIYGFKSLDELVVAKLVMSDTEHLLLVPKKRVGSAKPVLAVFDF